MKQFLAKYFGLEVIILNNLKNLFCLLKEKYPKIKYSDWMIYKLKGDSGRSFLIKQKYSKYKIVARKYKKNSFLGISNKREGKILDYLFHFNYSPKLLARRKDWLLIEWIDGRIFNKNIDSFWKFCNQLAKVYSELHSLILSGYSLKIKKYLSNCWFLIDTKRSSPLWLKLHRFFQNLRQPNPTKTVLSHLDVHINNILLTKSGVLKLLDWEYSFDCDLAFDLASLFLNNNWDTKKEVFFLKSYCLNKSSYRNLANLNKKILMWKPWVNYMNMMWYEIRWNQTKNEKYLKLSYPIRKNFNLN